MIISETHHGFNCANVGIDASNISGDGMEALLPVAPDASARGIRDRIKQRLGVELGTSPLGYFGCVAAFLTLNFGSRIDRISVPTLFISGADDQRGGPPTVMQALAGSVPGARHVSVPNAAHICNIQNPEGFNEVLGAFLRQPAG